MRLLKISIFLLFIIGIFSNCVTTVKTAPPPPKIEKVGLPPFPGAIWVKGHWKYSHGQWTWVPGHWAKPPRPGAVWVPGHWKKVPGGWRWVPGHWKFR